MTTWKRATRLRMASHAILCRGNVVRCIRALILFGLATPAAFAQGVAATVQTRGRVPAWSVGEAFTFIFVALGPLNVIGPFATATQGRNRAVKRGVAFRALLLAAIALVVAATVGAKTLHAWGISVGALLLAAGLILFLVALQPILAGYAPRTQLAPTAATVVPDRTEAELALSPVAFPTIVTPYGLALLILLLTLYPLRSERLSIAVIASVVLALDLVAMLCTDVLMKIPFIKIGLDILGCVMGILLISLGLQAMSDGFRLLRSISN